MRTLLKVALLLACFAWSVNAQAQSSHGGANQGESVTVNHASANASEARPEPVQKSSIWDEPFRFNTKANDACTMTVSGLGDRTKLRVACKSKGKSYWCIYFGKPNLCRSYSNNPRHYFTQIMWELRKLPNACQGARTYKPQMCRKAEDEAQMVFQSSGPKTPAPRPTLATPKQQQPKPGVKLPANPASKPVKTATAKPVQHRKQFKITTPRPTDVTESTANQLAEEYCWKSLQSVCAFFINWFN